MREETEETSRVLKGTNDSLASTTGLVEKNEERIKNCYTLLSSLFLIYHEVNQSEDAYRAIEEALELLLLNNIQISQTKSHEWNDEPKFKNTLALIRKIRAERDERLRIACQKKAAKTATDNGCEDSQEYLITWEQFLKESTITPTSSDSQPNPKPSFKQKILDALKKK